MNGNRRGSLWKTMEVWRGDNLVVFAVVWPDTVRFAIIETYSVDFGILGDPGPQYRGLYGFEVFGYTKPKDGGWFRRSQLSIGEAMQKAIDVAHRKEFMIREAEAQIEASRAGIRALADLEREMGS